MYVQGEHPERVLQTGDEKRIMFYQQIVISRKRLKTRI